MLHNILEAFSVVLASASPRRQELLQMLQIAYDIRISEIAEPITDDDPAIQAMNHARNKAIAVAQPSNKSELVVAADTIVVLGKRILGKPNSISQAQEYLQALSGKEHTVITGLAIGNQGCYYSDYECSLVQFADLSTDEIISYIESKEPMDKAGAYGIQGLGSQFIRGIQGCYFNVMGFPIHKFYTMLSRLQKEGKI
ncbi:MAG: Maf family protein [Candidatus Cloacimonetes bacterium]|nr:Maf family protein [Candidatus Cloacimonadota bacterium]MDD2683117.1 Maf family protein [Candidatus Cloacimonadota bacterium]